ncbi:Ig-like domain-containing protein [Cystobacter fuscus]|uniref:Ig-like domain-containing protein n=1 Tax=Cystobacter fuscus TaxID=43 RepID=UPI0037BF7AE4
MKFHKALPWLPAVLVLGGCPGSPMDETPRLSTIAVTCAPNPVGVGRSSRCTASATDQNGDTFSVSGFTWSSSDEAVAKVDAEGTATGVALGTATVTASATAEGVTQTGQASLSVMPTLHATPITADETWRVADNPHLVRGQLTVDNGATLTLEAGVDVRFEQDAELRIRDGELQAPGTAQAPIQLSAYTAATPGSWRGVVLATDKGVSALSHVTLSHCGQASGEGACLAVLNKAAPVLQDVTVRGSGGAGVKVAEEGGFGAESARLKVTDSAGYAVRLDANQVSTLPAECTFTGNVRDAIEITGNVLRTQTWTPRCGAYVLNGVINVEGPDQDTNITLTLSAGTELRFGANAEFNVGFNGKMANVMVEGSATAPIRFTADSDNPMPGHWRGVHIAYWRVPSRITHAIFEYAGAGDHSLELDGRGNLNLYGSRNVPTPVVSNVILQKSSGPGLYVGHVGVGAGSGKLTVRDNGRYAMSINGDDAGSALVDTVFINNTPNSVEILGGIGTTQTWPKLSVPYTITSRMEVGSIYNPTLTLTAGTEIQFARGASLVIAYSSIWKAALVAKGTAAAPIRFVPDVETLERGYWNGLHFWKADGSVLDHVLVTNGGVSNNSNPGDGVLGDANVNVYREIGPFITNSSFMYATGCAIRGASGFREGTTQVTTQFLDAAYKNTATSNTGNRQCPF